jgi:AcrR family transcriptional regulator
VDKREQRKEMIMQGALELFAKQGFYATTIPDIAKALDISVGNIYNYFPSKDILARKIIASIASDLADQLHTINAQDISTKKKTREIVKNYFHIAQVKPEMTDYFLRIYLSNREVFRETCKGMSCIDRFVREIYSFFENGVASGELRDQDRQSALGLLIGYLSGMIFLKGEDMLPRELDAYVDDIADNIYRVLKK